MTSELNRAGPETLKNIRMRAVIDWVWVCITLSSPSQFRHVQKRMLQTFGKLYVTSGESDVSSLNFAFKIQDPPGPDQLMHKLQSAVRDGDPPITENDVKIMGLELAIDGYHTTSDPQALARAVMHFFVHHAHPPAGQPRISRPKHYRVPLSKRDILDELSLGFTLHGGPKYVDYSTHFYVKCHDTIDGVKYTLLPPAQHRARFEITWQGVNAVPFKTIDEWRKFKFETLSTKYALVVPTSKEGMALLVQDRKIQHGRSPDSFRRRPSDRTKRSPNTRRDSVTNDEIRQALRRLTRLQSCQNSVKNVLHKMPASLGEFDLEALSPRYLNTYLNTGTEASVTADSPEQASTSAHAGSNSASRH